MSAKPFAIVPFKTGLEKDRESFLIEEDAFPTFNDCHIYHGKVRRRGGNRLLGRLVQLEYQKALGDTGTSPFTVANVWNVAPAVTGVIQIQPGSVTVEIAAPVGASTYTDDGAGNLSDGAGNTGTINYTSGALSVDHGAGGASAVTITFSYYTGRPVMGLRVRETSTLNQEDLIAFDTVKSNLFNRGTLRFDDISYDNAGNAIQWSANNYDFFWTWNYYRDSNGNKLFWATNNKKDSTSGGVSQDGIRIYNGTAAVPGASGGWYLQTPQITSTPTYLRGCLILISYKGRMVALNTLEGAAAPAAVTRYSNRARWCQVGVPYTNTLGGFDATAWRDDQTGKGGYIDAPTAEQIVSCEFYKNTLIVFFERSTWQLVYTGNELLPFVWQRINTELGCESTFSTVPFDKGVLAVGQTAIISSDSVNVERIDQKIPEEVFDFHNANNGPKRVYGIRDYFFQLVYWTFPNDDQNDTFPNKMLVLNYKEGSYSFYNDSITCLGYYQAVSDRTWATSTFAWNSTYNTWSSGRLQSDYPSVIGGNQQGFTFLIEQARQSSVTLYVTNITQAANAVVTCPNHNLKRDQYVKFSSVEGMTEINNGIGKIVSVTNANTFTVDINSSGYTAYTRAGLLEVLFGFEVITKKINPYFTQGKKIRADHFDLYVNKTTGGEITLDVLGDDNTGDPIETNTVSTTQEYGPIMPVEKVWQRVYTDTSGQFLQFKMYLNDTQMRDNNIRNSDITIHAFNIWLKAIGHLQSFDRLS